MKLEKKLEGFMQIAIDEAKEQTDKTLSQVEKEFNSACDEYRKNANEAAKKHLKDEYLNFSREKNREITQTAAKGKKDLIALRTKLLEGVFENVLARLHSYVETSEYKKRLLDEIRDAGRGAQTAIVYLMPRDAEILRGGEFVRGRLSFEITDEDFIGGFKMKRDEHVLIDNTYKTKFDDAKRNTNIFRIE